MWVSCFIPQARNSAKSTALNLVVLRQDELQVTPFAVLARIYPECVFWAQLGKFGFVVRAHKVELFDQNATER